ncbi:MAG: PH domain-containing protein [Clostridiaceae bacterium]|nr:PH domain-containing protein [Clostridiaceae bacterium]
MKLKGKIAAWFWIIFIGGNLLMLYELLFSRDSLTALIIGFLIFNVVFLPIIVRNYVEIENDVLTVAFGFGKDSIRIGEITEIYQTHNPISSSAASLDRIVIKGRRKEIIFSVCDKDSLFQEIKRQNPSVILRG